VNSKVMVVARVRAKPGLETKVKDECLALVGPSRAEKGCINYDLYRAIDDPTLFVFYENWESREDIERHLEMPYCSAFDEQVDGRLAEPEEIILCEMVS
jgi:quinol monooxygenase YgiN